MNENLKMIGISLFISFILLITLILLNLPVSIQYQVWDIGIFCVLFTYTILQYKLVGIKDGSFINFIIILILSLEYILKVAFNFLVPQLLLTVAILLVAAGAITYSKDKKGQIVEKVNKISSNFEVTSIALGSLLLTFVISLFNNGFVSHEGFQSINNSTITSIFNLTSPFRNEIFSSLMNNYNTSFTAILIAATALLGLYILMFISILQDEQLNIFKRTSVYHLISVVILIVPIILLISAITSSFSLDSYANSLALYFNNPGQNSTVINAAETVFTAASKIQSTSILDMIVALFMIMVISTAYLIHKFSLIKEHTEKEMR